MFQDLPVPDESKTRLLDTESPEVQLREAMSSLNHLAEQMNKLHEERTREQERLAVARDALQKLCIETSHYLEDTPWSQANQPDDSLNGLTSKDWSR